MNLGLSFLTQDNLKLIYTEEEVVKKSPKDRSSLRVQLVDRGCHNFIFQRSGKVLKATKGHRISTQAWRIPHERVSINAVSERPEEAVGVYAKDECSTPSPQEWVNISLCRLTVE